MIMAGVCILATCAARAVAGNNPVDETWWPSEFGADDQAGAVKSITPEKRLAAVQLVKQGKPPRSGCRTTMVCPWYSGRTFALSIPGGGTPTHGPLSWPGGAHYAQTFMDEMVTAEIGQVGTQWTAWRTP